MIHINGHRPAGHRNFFKRVISIKARAPKCPNMGAMWKDISTAPFERDLELAVIDRGVHTLVFPCVRTEDGWHNAETMKPVDVAPTHWQYWPQYTHFNCCG